MRKKGVSNLISAVLLMVIALSLASVLYGWSTGWIGEQLGRVEQISQGEFASEVATLYSDETGVLIVRNVGTENIKICDNNVNVLITLYLDGTIVPTPNITQITDSTIVPAKNLKVANGELPRDHILEIHFNSPIEIDPGKTYEIMLTLSDGTPLILAVTAIEPPP